jgi:DNA-binding MarR family transcriptional regulator
MAEPQIDPAGIGALLQLDPIIHAPARLSVLTYLSVVERSDFVFLKNMTGLTWGNLSTHLSKLEEAGYVEIEKQFKGKKPQTMIRLTDRGRAAFQAYREDMQRVLDDLPQERAASKDSDQEH